MTSPNLQLPGPGEGDSPDGPVQIQALIDRLEALRGGYSEIGAMQDYAGSTDPNPTSGCWLICDNRILLRNAYPDLFAVVGTTYNIGGEANTEFRIPGLGHRVVYSAQAGDRIGEVGGAEAVTLTNGQMPQHSHGGATSSPQSGPSAALTGGMNASNPHNHGGGTASMNRSNPHGHGDYGHTHNVPNLASGNSKVVIWTGGAQGQYWIAPGVGNTGSGTGYANLAATDINHEHGVNAQDINHAHAVPNLSISPDGGSQPHSNMPPFIRFFKIIRVK